MDASVCTRFSIIRYQIFYSLVKATAGPRRTRYSSDLHPPLIMADSFSPIPHGNRLIPSEIDRISSLSPTKLFACIPRTASLSDGYRDVTYRGLARGIDRAAAWIEERFGVEGKGMFGTLAYLGVWDLRYWMVVIGACKVGYKVSWRFSSG